MIGTKAAHEAPPSAQEKSSANHKCDTDPTLHNGQDTETGKPLDESKSQGQRAHDATHDRSGSRALDVGSVVGSADGANGVECVSEGGEYLENHVLWRQRRE